MTKLAHAHKNNTDVASQLSKSKIIKSGIPLELTSAEYNLIMSNSWNHNIYRRVKRGGFLPAILAALPTIGTVLSGLAGASRIASNITNMVTGHGCHIPPKQKIPMAQQHKQHKAQGLISDLNIPIISPLAKFIGLGKKKRAAGQYLNKARWINHF